MHMWAWYIHTHTKAYLHTGTHTQASTRLWIQTLTQTGGEHSFCLASECFEPSRHWPWTYRSQFVCKTDSPTHGHPDTRTLAHTRVWGVIKTTSIQCFFFVSLNVLCFCSCNLLVLPFTFINTHEHWHWTLALVCVFAWPHTTLHSHTRTHCVLSLRSFLAVGALLPSLSRPPVTAPASSGPTPPHHSIELHNIGGFSGISFLSNWSFWIQVAKPLVPN